METPDQQSILVVDDDENFRSVLTNVLREEGFYIEEAGDGKSAIDAAKLRPFDIILLDVKMPVMNGLEALKILRKDFPNTDYMMITGVHDISLAVEAVKLGAREYLTKPFEADALIQQIKSTLRARAAEARLHEIELNFASHLLYDLRTPITTINTAVGFLLKGMAGPLSDQQQVVLSHMNANTEKIVSLINDMIDLTKLESGRVDLDKMATNFDQVIPPLVEQFDSVAVAKKITIKVEISPNIPTLELDIEKFGQVVTNLLDNAIKYTNEGGVVTLKATTSKPDSHNPDLEFVEFTVSDTGAGISPDELPFIFDKYKEMLTGKTSAKKTTGLGLAICRRIVEAHWGRMIAESEPGKGTTFTILLPID